MDLIFSIKWTFGSVSKIISMVIGGSLKNSPIMGSFGWIYISAATRTQLFCIFFKGFGISWCVKKLWLIKFKNLMNNVRFHNFWKNGGLNYIVLFWRVENFLFWFLFSLSWWYIRFSFCLKIFCIAFWIYQIPLLVTNFLIIFC